MERILKRTLLYDFYGELLTEHQRQIYEDVVLSDLTISEVARERGTSRQSVHDMIRRCDKILEEYECKLGLVEQFIRTREKAEQIRRLAGLFSETKDMDCIRQIEVLARQIEETERTVESGNG